MTVKKFTVSNLKAMVKEAVALQMKQSAADRRAKMADDKEKANADVKENKTIRVTVEQLRSMVKEAVQSRLTENMGMPAIGDLVAFKGKSGHVEDVSPDGRVAVSRDGIRMEWLPMNAVQVLATAEDLAELSPEEVASIGDEMGMGANQDPGENPADELERRQQQLQGFSLGKPTRTSLGNREKELKTQLGIPDDEY